MIISFHADQCSRLVVFFFSLISSYSNDLLFELSDRLHMMHNAICAFVTLLYQTFVMNVQSHRCREKFLPLLIMKKTYDAWNKKGNEVPSPLFAVTQVKSP